MSKKQLLVKRLFDIILAILMMPLLVFPIIVLVILASIDTRAFGVFQQERIGQHGKSFMMYKIRSLQRGPHIVGHLNKSATGFGRWIRRNKFDELPQIYNVMVGHMSFVGPRPDVRGYADKLNGEDRIILKVKPGITGPATLKYKHEEQLLAQQPDPIWYNDHVIWPDKVKINCWYIAHWSFWNDVKWLIKSV